MIKVKNPKLSKSKARLWSSLPTLGTPAPRVKPVDFKSAIRNPKSAIRNPAI